MNYLHECDLFEKIATEFKVSWDPVELTRNWEVRYSEEYKIISDKDGLPHWQDMYGIYFGRNFHKNYKAEVDEILSGLTKIQSALRKTITPKSEMMECFLNHVFVPHRVNLTMVQGGGDIILHIDQSRMFAVNIGVKNSNTCLTHAWSMDTELMIKTLINSRSKKYTYQHQDNEVYLLNTGIPHSVETLVPKDPQYNRYVIGYILKDRDPLQKPKLKSDIADWRP